MNWTEPWLRALMGFHCLLFLVAIVWRKNVDLQMAVLGVVSILVFCSEQINALAGENWHSFSTQNYFDEHGAFAGALFCAPLLCIAFFQLINLLVLAGSALITAKRLQLSKKISDDKKKKK